MARGGPQRIESEARWADVIGDARRMYLEDELPLAAVAERIGMSPEAVRKAFRRYGVPLRSRANVGARNGRYRDGSEARMYRGAVEKRQCERCGTAERLGVHHCNGDHYDNRPDNLSVLCVSCHSSVHKAAWWAAKKAGLPLPKSNAPIRWSSAR